MTLMTICGYIAAGLVFCTFWMKTMVSLRYVAISSNVAFLLYGYLGELHPVMTLHAILLPLNCIRLYEMKKLIRESLEAAKGDLSLDWLLPFMTKRRFKKGDVLFRKGDISEEMYYIHDGVVHLEEIGVNSSPGELVGEIGLFSPDKRRTVTALCHTDVDMFSITGARVMQIYYQNPRFGYYLVQLITKRLIENVSRMEAEVVQKEIRISPEEISDPTVTTVKASN